MAQEQNQKNNETIPAQLLPKQRQIFGQVPNNEILRSMFGKLKSQSLATAYESSLLFKNNQHSLQSLKSVKRIMGYGKTTESKHKKVNNQNHFNQLHLQKIMQLQNIKQIEQNTNATIDSTTKIYRIDGLSQCQERERIILGKQIVNSQFPKVYNNLASNIQTEYDSKGQNGPDMISHNSGRTPYVQNNFNPVNLPQINFKLAHFKNHYSDLSNIFKTQTVKLKSKKQLNFNIIYIKKNKTKLANQRSEQEDPVKEAQIQKNKNFMTLDPINSSRQEGVAPNITSHKEFLQNLSSAYTKYRITRQPANYNQYLELQIQKNRRIHKLNIFRKENQRQITNQLLHKKKLELLKENFEANHFDQQNPESPRYRKNQESKNKISITTSARLNEDEGTQTKDKNFLSKQASLRKMPSITAPFSQAQLQTEIVAQPKFMKGYMNYHPQGKQFYSQNKENLSNPLRLNNILFAPLGLTAKSYAVFNSHTLTPIAHKNFKGSIQIASISKVMTCYLSLLICKKYQINYKTYSIKVTEKASQMPGTSAELQRGDIITIQQLLYGLMLPSGNDASVAIAETLGKVIQKYKKKPTKKTFYETFIAHMNLLARQLNLEQEWKNSSGLPTNPNICTSQSVCLLTSIAMKDEKFRQIVNTKVYQTQIKNQMFGLTRRVSWKNTNKLLNDGWQGVKTGTTEAAGHCLLSKKQKYLIAVYDCQTLSKRFSQCQALYDLIKKHEHQF